MTLIQSPGWRWLHSGESWVSFLIPSQPGSRSPAPGHNGVCCGAAAANERPGHAASANQEAGPSRDQAPGRGLGGGQSRHQLLLLVDPIQTWVGNVLKFSHEWDLVTCRLSSKANLKSLKSQHTNSEIIVMNKCKIYYFDNTYIWTTGLNPTLPWYNVMFDYYARK